MADVYQIADGHDQEASFADVDPQPKSHGVGAPVERYAITADVFEDGGKRTFWEFSSLTATEYQTILTAFGLSMSVKTNDCTIHTTEQDRTWSDYNGKIVRPNLGPRNWRDGFLNDVVFEIRNLEAT